ncbi:uncharacterized protein LOC101209410 [Cucumis sativus]|uniref:AT3G52170-like helix-turn-helix domain-containing protein n=1 Tax=Cucumis sativus TaxID=3659 RepID=A0A0A0M0E7_CUCSA|nr:uncharacterized protein LOC101209410 [Cucumis sativus]XP_011658023.1 uncharacterized protein LOC101209410 [Cucumis sativus]KGN65696.1 hypothetical protein Csa_020100 [Cucumis sativus]
MVKMRIKLLPTRRLHSYSSADHLNSGLKSSFSRKELDNFVPYSNTWWRGRSYVPSVASDIPGPEKDRKRVSKEERRAMVESFVHKYKASNTGKFPSAANTCKEVGGSYYVVRKILQELQSESSMSSLKGRSKNSFQETEIKSNGSLTEERPNAGRIHLEAASELQKSSRAEKILSADDDVSHSVLPVRSNLLEDSEDVISSHKKPCDDDKKFDVSEHFSTESHALKNERDAVSDVHLESRSSSEELKHEEGSYGKEQQVQSSPKLHRENVENRTVDEAQHTATESKPWGERIKSIVDGIVNMWWKR